MRPLARLALVFLLSMTLPFPADAAFPDSARARDAATRVTPALERDLAARHLQLGAPAYLRIFKRESELELWMRGSTGDYALFRTYPICKFSGELGPKQKTGDRQAPEGFYSVSPKQLYPMSQFHLGFDLGYPNAYDRSLGRTGDFLLVHGHCVSIGCYAMGDAAIEEIYTLVAAALRAGQPALPVHAFPFRMTTSALAAEKASPWQPFWHELAPAYELFERDRVPPAVSVQEGHYRIASGLRRS